MTPNALVRALRRQQFRPFVIHTGSGQQYKVPHPERAMISESGRTVWVALPEEDAAILDLESITEIVATRSRRQEEG